MKNTLLTIIITSLFLGSGINSLSQENYVPAKILSLNNDTLFGFINYQEWERNPKVIEFKSSQETEKLEYTAEELNAFWVKNDYYLSRKITVTESPRKPDQLAFEKEKTSETITAFILVLVAGETSLCKYVDEMSTDRYYLEKKGSEIQELIYYKYYVQQPNGRMITENRKYAGQLIYYFQDCEDIKKDIDNADYTDSDLMRVVEKYNLCTNSKVEYVHIKEKSKMRIGLLAGASLTMINFNDDAYLFKIDPSEIKNSVCPTIGFSFELVMPRSREKWSWYNDLIIKRHRYNTIYQTADSENYSAKYTTTLNATYIKWTTMARFHIVGHKVVPYFSAGMFGEMALYMKNEQTQEIRFGEETTTKTISELFEPYTYDYGIAFSIGGKLKDFRLEARYDIGLVDTYGYISSNTRTVYLFFGYNF